MILSMKPSYEITNEILRVTTTIVYELIPLNH